VVANQKWEQLLSQKNRCVCVSHARFHVEGEGYS